MMVLLLESWLLATEKYAIEFKDDNQLLINHYGTFFYGLNKTKVIGLTMLCNDYEKGHTLI